jgi:hypothetical protein
MHKSKQDVLPFFNTKSCHIWPKRKAKMFAGLMPALTLVSLLERYLVLETAMPRDGDIRKRPSAHL